MEPLAYIHAAMTYEESPDNVQPVSDSRTLNWWQMSSTVAVVLVIIFGGFTKVVSAFANPTITPIEQQVKKF